MKGYRGEEQLQSFLTLALKEASGYHHLLAALPPGENPGTYCIRGWTFWRREKSHAHSSILSPDHLAPSSRYTNYATLVHTCNSNHSFLLMKSL